MQGQGGPAKETECVLLWDGEKLILERIGMQVTSLRHVRDEEANPTGLCPPPWPLHSQVTRHLTSGCGATFHP